MQIARLTSLLLGTPRQSLPRPKLRHDRRLALLSHLSLTLNLYTLSFTLSLALLPHLPPLLTVFLPGNRLRSLCRLPGISLFCFSARGYLSEICQATCLEESHSSFCSPFSLAEFLAAAPNLSSSSATGPDEVAYLMPKHLPRSGMAFLLYIFNIYWSLHFFPSIWKTSSIITTHKMGKPLDSPASFRPISLTSCVSKLFERIILSHLLFFLELIPFFLPTRLVSALDGLHLIKFCTFLSPFQMGLANPGRALGRSCLLSISPKLLTQYGILLFSTNSFRLASLFALLTGLKLAFLICALLWFFKITKVIPFESVEVFCKDSFLALYFSLSSSMIFRLLCLHPSAALFMLMIWPFGPPPPQSPLWWRPHKELCFDGALV